MVKKQPSFNQRKQREQGNKKAMMWVSSVLGVIVVILAVMIFFNNR